MHRIISRISGALKYRLQNPRASILTNVINCQIATTTNGTNSMLLVSDRCSGTAGNNSSLHCIRGLCSVMPSTSATHHDIPRARNKATQQRQEVQHRELRVSADEVLDMVVNKLRQLTPPVTITNIDVSANNTGVGVLLNAGSPMDQVVSLFEAVPELLSEPAAVWQESRDFFHQAGFGLRQYMEMITLCPELLHTSNKQIIAAMNAMRALNMSTGVIVSMAHRCPELLISDPKFLLSQGDLMLNFFSRAQMIFVVRTAPWILLRDTEAACAVYDYIFFAMGIEQPQFKKTRWWMHDLDKVRARHEFLTRTGAYVKPDPKRSQVAKHNPKLWAILDTPDSTFATDIAGVTMEEYHVFLSMFKRQLDDETAQLEDEDDSDDE